jgi:electron transfer flavoprotein alpha/beta subunit
LPTPTTGRQLRVPPARQMGFIVEGEPQEAAQTLIGLLRARRVI